MTDKIRPTQHQITSTLLLLSNALRSGHSLPPHMALPRPYELTQQLEALSRSATETTRGTGLLDARHMNEAGYTEFAALQVCATLVCDDIEGLVGCVGQLVGVVDFRLRVEGGSSNLLSGESHGDKGKGKAD